MSEEFKFVECSICASKPGSPVLCNSCLANRETISKLNDKIKSLINPSETNSLCIDGEMIVNWEVTEGKNKFYPDLSKAKDVYEKEEMLINYYVETQLEPAITGLIHRQFQKEVDEYLQSLRDEGKI